MVSRDAQSHLGRVSERLVQQHGVNLGDLDQLRKLHLRREGLAAAAVKIGMEPLDTAERNVAAVASIEDLG